MATLPMEMIKEVLSRLPVKPLLRFNSVCKSWYALVKNPNFIKIHLNQSLKSNIDRHLILSNFALLAKLDIPHVRFFELHDHPVTPVKLCNQKLPRINCPLVVGTCGGLLCITVYIRSKYLVMYNPLTNTHHKLPDPLPISCRHISAYVFGYDSAADDFKVLIVVFDNQPKYRTTTEVYSLKNNSWKWVQDFPSSDFFPRQSGVLVNQALHYLVIKENITPKGITITMTIISFDLCSETYLLQHITHFWD